MVDEVALHEEADWAVVAAGYQRAIRSFEVSVQHILRDFDVSNLGLTNVLFLVNIGDSPKRVVDLVKQQNYAGSNASYALEMLERSGLVDRSVDEEDRRIRVVALTQRGQNLLAEIKGVATGDRDVIAAALDALALFEQHFAGTAAPQQAELATVP